MNRRATLAFGAIISLVIFAVMGVVVTNTTPWDQSGSDASTAQANDLDSVVNNLFGPQVIAFEVLGILLTAAMIGALVIARPMDAVTDESRYSHPTAEQVAETQHVSDVGQAVMTGPSTVPAAEVPE
jgi:hypothetical protein